MNVKGTLDGQSGGQQFSDDGMNVILKYDSSPATRRSLERSMEENVTSDDIPEASVSARGSDDEALSWVGRLYSLFHLLIADKTIIGSSVLRSGSRSTMGSRLGRRSSVHCQRVESGQHTSVLC
jgi:hypothetical protein